MNQTNKSIDFKHIFELTSKEELLFNKKETKESPIFVKVISLIAGFFINILFLVFLFILDVTDNPYTVIVLGSVLLIGVFVISRMAQTEITQLILISFYACGITLFSFGIMIFGDSNYQISILSLYLTCIALISIVIFKQSLFIYISTALLLGSIMAFLYASNLYIGNIIYKTILILLIPFLFLNEGKLITKSAFVKKIYKPLLLTSMILLVTNSNYSFEIDYKSGDYIEHLFLIPFLATLVSTVWAAGQIQKKFHPLNITKRVFFFITIIVLAYFLNTSLIVGIAFLYILLSFYIKNNVVFCLSILAFIYGISHLYYYLNITLLTKSILLMATGVICIGLYFFIKKQTTDDTK